MPTRLKAVPAANTKPTFTPLFAKASLFRCASARDYGSNPETITMIRCWLHLNSQVTGTLPEMGGALFPPRIFIVFS
jgi:hypothetical protein